MTPLEHPLASASSSLAADWVVIAVYLVATTVVGAKLAGKQSTIRDFFLAGRKLPWWAISGSIIATEISATTFIAVPAISARMNGDFRYLQLAIGSIIARIIIAYYFVPRFYEQEIYSPYDYAGQRLGPRVKRLTTGLFFVSAVLGQGVRVYTAAFLMQVISGLDLVYSIWAITLFSVAWTFFGGMTTVIWTDVAQFVVMCLGAIVCLVCAVGSVDGGIRQAYEMSLGADKYRLFDFTSDLSVQYTFWCGLIAMPFLNLAALGTDQVMAQRMFCCRDQRDAKKAVLFSMVGIGVAVLMLTVGAALYVYFLQHPLSAAELATYRRGAHDENYWLPLFIVRAVPVGVRGVIIAAVLASAISTLESALAALAQGTVGGFVQSERKSAAQRVRRFFGNDIRLSRALVVAWGLVLAGMATACITLARRYHNAVDLAFALVAYTYGPLLGVFLLAFLGTKRDDAGLAWAVPIAMLAVFSASVHDLRFEVFARVGIFPSLAEVDLSRWIVAAGAGYFLLAPIRHRRLTAAQAAGLVGAILFVVLLHEARFGPPGGRGEPLAWTWYYPIGAGLTFGLGWLLGNPRGAAARRR